MKKATLLVLFVVFILLPFQAFAYVNVKGYYRSNGTYVAPHVRSNPNGLKSDNYGYTGGDVYNKTYGTRGATWDTPTSITDPDYYVGKALYESDSSGYSAPSTYSSSETKSKVVAPANAYVSGAYWYCNTGYREVGNSCIKE